VSSPDAQRNFENRVYASGQVITEDVADVRSHIHIYPGHENF